MSLAARLEASKRDGGAAPGAGRATDTEPARDASELTRKGAPCLSLLAAAGIIPRMDSQNVVFALVVLAATGFFYYSAQRLIGYLRIGRADPRWDHPLARLWNVLRIAIFQKKIFRDHVAGPMHALIFWGFIVLTAGTVELIVHGIVETFSYARFLPPVAYFVYSISQDLFAVIVLAAVLFALFRRLVLHPKRLQGDGTHQGDAILILSMIGGLMVTMLLRERLRHGRRRPAALRQAGVAGARAAPLLHPARRRPSGSSGPSGGRTRCSCSPS